MTFRPSLFFRRIKNVIEFIRLDETLRILTFYSEGENYWPHLEGMISWLLANTATPICYISSNSNDPGLALEHPNFRSFQIDEGAIRNWLFENIDTKIMVMTMPDIGVYQVKRSKYPVHYVYTQHSFVSLHMVYREGAFDHYDTIFCAGPHHVDEINAIIESRKLPEKQIFEHGYSRLDAIISEANNRPRTTKGKDAPFHILVAPSWGKHSTVESGVGRILIKKLLSQGHQVTFRPHPQTIKFAPAHVREIVNENDTNPRFLFEDNVAGQNSLQDSDLMISDWSGAAFDYALGLSKPVLFVDVPKKVNNENYTDIPIEPIEVSIRNRIGKIVHPLDESFSFESLNFDVTPPDKLVFNLGHCDEVGARELSRMLAEME